LLKKILILGLLMGKQQLKFKKKDSIYDFNNLGFTLIEILICLAILGTLAAIAIPNYIVYRDRAKTAVAIHDLRIIQDIILNYQISWGQFPDTLDQAGIKRLKDPWGNSYQYLRIEGADIKGKGKLRKDRSLVPVNSDFDLYSVGPDGKSQPPFTAKTSLDDIVRAADGGYFGKASDF
jgi:general secretion pathway protein G